MWTFAKALNQARTGFALIQYEDRLYALGGATNNSAYAPMTKSVEMYDNSVGWIRFPIEIAHSDSYFAAAVLHR